MDKGLLAGQQEFVGWAEEFVRWTHIFWLDKWGLFAGQLCCWLGKGFFGWEKCLLAGKRVCWLEQGLVGWERRALADKRGLFAGKGVCWLGKGRLLAGL